MNYKMILHTIGKILCVESALMIPAFFISLGYGEADSMRGLATTIVLTAAIGILLLILLVPKNKNFYAREGFFTVALAWIVISLFGALPFFFSGAIPSFVDCWFETVSGFTTTGASIIPDVLSIPRGLLYWRSFTHWLGGMGVLVFVLALQPMARGGGGQAVHLLRAESPGPEVEKLAPRMHQTAKILYSIYIGMTLLQILLLALGGMPLFDNICITFGSAGTGGFAVLPDSIASYSPYIQWVVTIFMALFGVNFSIYYLFLIKKPRQALKSEELRWYVGILLAATILVAVNTWGMHGGAAETIRHSAFQVSSIMTTTGYATVDFSLWPEFSRWVLMILMIVGACAGSTGGGIKVSRFVLMLKSLLAGGKRLRNPRAVSLVKMDGKTVSERTLHGLSLYMTAYVFILASACLLVGWNGLGIETTLSSVFSCLNNVGPGLDVAGPYSSYAGFSVLSKLVLSAAMLFGRLEIFPLLMIFSPALWSRKRS